MLNLRKKILGLDAGSRTLKGALLQREGTEVFLRDFFFHDLRQENTEHSPEQRILTMEALVAGRGFGRLPVAGTIEDKEVQVMHISLPEMPAGEVEAAVRNKVEMKAGIDANQLAIDYSFIDAGGSNSGREKTLRAYYTTLEVVRAQTQALQSANLQPISIESGLHATIEALRFNEYIFPQTPCVVVDIGETHTSIGLVIGGSLAQLNTLRVGSGDINENLMTNFQCDYAESERMKLAYRLEKSDPGSAENMNRIIEDGYYRIILGIHDTVSYYKAAFKEQAIANLFLTGGGAAKDGLPSLMSQSLSLPVIVPNSLRKIQIYGPKQDERRESLPAIAHHLHAAIGLALRGV